MSYPRGHYRKFEPTEEDRARAAEVVAEGWSQRSRKYRKLGRVPGGVSGIEYMRANHPEDFARMYREAMARLESDCVGRVFHFHEETITLSEGEFEAWLDLQRASGKCVNWWTDVSQYDLDRAQGDVASHG